MVRILASSLLVLFAVTVWQTSANAGDCSGKPPMSDRKGTKCDSDWF